MQEIDEIMHAKTPNTHGGQKHVHESTAILKIKSPKNTKMRFANPKIQLLN